MASTKQTMDQETLQRMWQERCTQRNFSPAVAGIGTIRVFGRSGDTPIQFPRIESLAALDQLAEDEVWALGIAEEIVTAAQARNRQVMATQPPQAGTNPAPISIRTFDPKAEHILILSLTRGG